MTAPLLAELDGVSVDYRWGRRGTRRAVDDVSFGVAVGSTLGLVGESGSGKSTLAKALVGLAPVAAGEVRLDGVAQDGAGRRDRAFLRDVQYVFQDPNSSLNPTRTVGWSVAEPLLALGDRDGTRPGAEAVRSRVADMLARVGLPADAAGRYPAQFSGGQRQRIAIARALVVAPRLVVCDEVVSALDLSVQAQVLNLLTQLQRDLGLAYLFISHDLGVVEHMADQVLVLYRGRVMETGSAGAVQGAPGHPYTQALLAAAPVADPERQRERRAARVARAAAERRAPAPLGDSCPFTHRCALATDVCHDRRPQLRTSPSGTQVTCHRTEDAVATLPPAVVA
ncbi:oligopeptide/dipeptide ABC transporter ATP-binding protein [Klenkia sp. PcliD-1-E]|uniref:oligopeptide/dipeptide ABC transporter ATP-binding protein n=1 Tax=Klenkia sp. PcliD-1-E TaxID=2954492 RepID=UPI0020973D80|nr:oligopeptide/dipeptide ABC transporter ATP-binding protein [Klenkia sp. PcliD-1-E]MCO7220506.1 ATP-binding cassette domain-containing protein [Klenkia sp. PcliD-1-E]